MAAEFNVSQEDHRLHAFACAVPCAYIIRPSLTNSCSSSRTQPADGSLQLSLSLSIPPLTCFLGVLIVHFISDSLFPAYLSPKGKGSISFLFA